MKALKYIRRNSALTIKNATIHGGYGDIKIGTWSGSVVWGADENGWEHVSISPYHTLEPPSWSDMCIIKSIFWNGEETVFQIHPPRSKYVNLMENCLHLWRPKDGVHGMNPEWDEASE